MTIVASMCPVMESAGPTRPGDSDATMLRFDQYRDSGARVLNGFILEPELFRMPANSLQALFKFLQLVRRDFSEEPLHHRRAWRTALGDTEPDSWRHLSLRSAGDPMTSGSPVVFVVEDDSAVRDSLRRLVTSVGFMARNSAGT